MVSKVCIVEAAKINGSGRYCYGISQKLKNKRFWTIDAAQACIYKTATQRYGSR